jgi:hypothetical protein
MLLNRMPHAALKKQQLQLGFMLTLPPALLRQRMHHVHVSGVPAC